MACTVDFTPGAESDLDSIIDWYSQFDPALADDFMVRLNLVVQNLTKGPAQAQKIYGNYRKANISRFPYKLIYRINKQVVIVVAIAHHKRRDYWKKRR